MSKGQSQKLSDLISSVRKCKTAAEERTVISKECALIRTYVKDNNAQHRARNVVKLMYIHMLGHPTQFGQMMCINLIIGEKFVDKRIGYLGLMVLLDESSEVLTLIENHLLKDMGNTDNQFIPGLAMCTVANISSEGMARGVSNKVLDLLHAGNPYIRKKAALCALRIIRKVASADMVDLYMEYYQKNSPFNERNHGVLVSILALINSVLASPDGERYLAAYRGFVTSAVRVLKNLVVSSYATEHDISGIADPFLQVKVLQFLRIVGKNDEQASDQMKDVLSDVITGTEQSKPVANAILYECVITIVNVESENQLRLMAVNILGQFLVNKDNNIRYVALHTLTQVVKHNVQAVQQHKDTIVDCLRDLDVSIRRRALDLIYALVNPSNIRLLVPDLINFLSVAPQDLKQDITTKICSVVDRYAPNPQWHVDTLIKVLTLAGSFVPESVGHKLVGLITQSPQGLQAYCVKAFWGVMRQNAPTHQSFTQTAEGGEEAAVSYCKKQTLVSLSIWCIGEYGDLLIADAQDDLSAEDISVKDWRKNKPNATQVLTVLGSFLFTHYITSNTLKQQTLMATFKLAGRSSEIATQVQEIYATFGNHKDIEIQQRAVEFSKLLHNVPKIDTIVERMPPVAQIETQDLAATIGEQPSVVARTPTTTATKTETKPTTTTTTTPAAPPPAAPPVVEEKKQTSVLDEMDLLLDMSTPTTAGGATTQNTGGGGAPAKPNDTFDDLFGPTPGAGGSTGGGFGEFVSAPPPQKLTHSIPVYQQPGAISLEFQLTKDAANNNNTTNITAVIRNLSQSVLNNVSLLTAMGTNCNARVKLDPLPATTIAAGQAMNVSMAVENLSNPHAAVTMRVKLQFAHANGQWAKDWVVDAFPNWV
eukprot:TRINITY_DN59966_c0_g1_i1.p1 TRINITY_DN59966_c0_g1~~TRINITY_DN59966_c0_g1_i1.p1  ORF type:complete len:878 (-),score=103.16 TRINITY_DN59966_c0_g1_i1:1901-4534(-)